MTPLDVDTYEKMLRESKFPDEKLEYLVSGFRNGFDLMYQGPRFVNRLALNLPLTAGSLTELWNKVMTEVIEGHFAGPFESVPFKFFIQSPIGLVPKDKGKKTRLIFHLSYPKKGNSVNSGIPEELCTVKYPDFNDAVFLCIKAGKFCHIAKSDHVHGLQKFTSNEKMLEVFSYESSTPNNKKVVLFCRKISPLWKFDQPEDLPGFL